MITRLHKVFPVLLALMILAAPGAPAQVQASQVDIPADLMSALLAASSQPFEAAVGGYHTHSGGLDFNLYTDGLQAGGEGIDWGIVLSGFGRGEQIAAVPEAEIAQTDGRIEYRRGALIEWYRDTALGVEQGFTIHQAPGGTGPIVLHLDLNTDLIGTPDVDGRGLSFAALDGQTLHYDHLRAWDASGVELDASLLYTPDQITLQLNDDGAAYPITIDPLVYNEQKVFASGEANDGMGYSVAISDGIVLVGAPSDDVGANADQGSARVFTREGTVWKQQQLTASDGAALDNFGSSVAISGNVALVGAPLSNVGLNSNQGAAYVFTLSGTTWTETKKLTASDGAADDLFGASVALSGNTALVGAYNGDVGANADQGAAYVFTGGRGWGQQKKLTTRDGAADDHFGFSVAISGDTALVGAYGDDIGANADQGSAYVFVRSEKTWTQQGKPLTASDGTAGDCFGISVALERDTALVGADHNDSSQGSAYIFTRNGTVWTQQGQPLTALDGTAGDHFGNAVAISGGTALVGARFDDDLQGSAYVFFYAGKHWAQQEKLIASDAEAGDAFGVAVALEGNMALMGAFRDCIGANLYQGSATVFTRRGSSWSQRWQLLANAGEPGDYFGHSVAMEGDTALVGVPDDSIDANNHQGSVYVFVRSGTTWTQQQKLTASDGAEGDRFGTSVAISGDTIVVGACFDTVGANDNQGSAYIFTRSGTTWTQQAKLTALDGAMYDCFGYSVAISGDTVLVGVPDDDVGANFSQGSAYVFTRSGSTWTQQAKLTALDGATYDWFGYSVAISGDTVLVGVPDDDVGANFSQGSAYVFVRSGSVWSQQAKLTAPDGAEYDWFGKSVAISGDTALVGAPCNNNGAAYVFVRTGTAWAQQAKLTASDGAGGDLFGVSVALKSDTALVGAYNVGYAEGAAYVFVRNGTTWSQQGKLTGSDIIWIDSFGISVALSDDAILVGADHGDVTFNYHQGTAYFYSFSATP